MSFHSSVSEANAKVVQQRAANVELGYEGLASFDHAPKILACKRLLQFGIAPLDARVHGVHGKIERNLLRRRRALRIGRYQPRTETISSITVDAVLFPVDQ